MSIMQQLYDREINVWITSFWDDGFYVRLGDEMSWGSRPQPAEMDAQKCAKALMSLHSCFPAATGANHDPFRA